MKIWLAHSPPPDLLWVVTSPRRTDEARRRRWRDPDILRPDWHCGQDQPLIMAACTWTQEVWLTWMWLMAQLTLPYITHKVCHKSGLYWVWIHACNLWYKWHLNLHVFDKLFYIIYISSCVLPSVFLLVSCLMYPYLLDPPGSILTVTSGYLNWDTWHNWDIWRPE